MAWKIGELTRLPLGYVGESNTRTITIDMREWLESFPSATIVVEVVRPDKTKYFAATEMENGSLIWVVNPGEVRIAGKGFAQITAIDLDTGDEYRSRVVGTIIGNSLEDFTSIELDDIDPATKWVNRVLIAAENAADSEMHAAESAEDAERAANDAKSAASSFSGLGWYNAHQYGILPTNNSAVNAVSWNKLLQTVQDAGGGTIYFPAGTYPMGTVTTVVKKGNLRIIGDGCATKINRWGNTPFLTIVGSSIYHATPDHVKDITIENITLHTSKGYTSELGPMIDAECADYLRICNVKFSGNGTHLYFREVFDSKIYATDFENSGRRWPEAGAARDSIDYTSLSASDFTPTVVMESRTVSYRQPGYEETGLELEVTNQVLFNQCRFEGYTGGAMLINGCNSLRATDCKFESAFNRVPHIIVAGTTFSATSFDHCMFGVASVTKDGVNTTTVPVIYSYTTWINNYFNVVFALLSIGSGKSKAADLIRLNPSSADQFGGNRIEAHVSSKMVESDVQSVADGNYVVNLVPEPARLNTNGNKTDVYIAELDGFSISPYPS